MFNDKKLPLSLINDKKLPLSLLNSRLQLHSGDLLLFHFTSLIMVCDKSLIFNFNTLYNNLLKVIFIAKRYGFLYALAFISLAFVCSLYIAF